MIGKVHTRGLPLLEYYMRLIRYIRCDLVDNRAVRWRHNVCANFKLNGRPPPFFFGIYLKVDLLR